MSKKCNLSAVLKNRYTMRYVYIINFTHIKLMIDDTQYI